MKNVAKMSALELRHEVMRHRITLQRIADQLYGCLAQTYSEISKAALRHEEDRHR